MIKRLLCIFLILFLQANLLSGCWSYREINDLAIVAGVSIDLVDDHYLLTVETVETEASGKEATTKSNVMIGKGETIFDAIRNLISISEHKLYWSHAKVFLVSEEVAKKSIIPIIDWVFRDAETRQDMWLLVAKDVKASDILMNSHGESSILSLDLFDMVKAQEQLSKAPLIPIWKIGKELSETTVCSAIPIIKLVEHGDKKVASVGGMAIFRDARMIGELSENETKYYLFAVNEIEGGIMPVEMKHSDKSFKISFEISESKTKTTVNVENEDEPEIELNITTKVFVGEVDGDMTVNDIEMLSNLKKILQKDIEENISKVCNKVLKEYKSDVFGFSKKIKIQRPDVWRKYESRNMWEDELKQKLKVKVKSNVLISLIGLIDKIPQR